MGFFDKSSRAKNILELFTYDIVTFFHDDYEEVEYEETESMFVAVYEQQLPWVELECFDTIQLCVFFDKHSFTGSNPINVKFYSKSVEPSAGSIAKVINMIHKIYGDDDKQRKALLDNEDLKLENNIWERIWTIESGESFVTTNLTSTGFVLRILFFNNLIKHLEKPQNTKE